MCMVIQQRMKWRRIRRSVFGWPQSNFMFMVHFQDIIGACIEEAFVYKGSGCILGWEGGTTYLE
jgi:hypothetical protein